MLRRLKELVRPGKPIGRAKIEANGHGQTELIQSARVLNDQIDLPKFIALKFCGAVRDPDRATLGWRMSLSGTHKGRANSLARTA